MYFLCNFIFIHLGSVSEGSHSSDNMISTRFRRGSLDLDRGRDWITSIKENPYVGGKMRFCVNTYCFVMIFCEY